MTKMKELLIHRGAIDNNDLKGSFKTVIYLEAGAKIFCFGKKYPTQDFRHYSWYHLGKHISNNKHYSVDIYGTLTIHGASVEDSGTFMCEIDAKTGKYTFKHEVTVVQFPSKSLHIHFVYTIRLCSPETIEYARQFIESKVKGKICSRNECKLSYIHSACDFQKFDNLNLRVTVPIVLPGVPNGNCNIHCLREKLEKVKEKVKENVISAVMHGSRLKIREEPKAMSVSYLETEDDNICNPGFEMKGTISKSLCIPCPPGKFLEKGYCIPCHLNHYNGEYAARECKPCFGHRITRSRGAISEEDCYMADSDVLWILFAIIIIVIPFILVCCCWGFLNFFGETLLGNCIDVMCLFMTCKLFRKMKRTKPNESERYEKSNKAFNSRFKSKLSNEESDDGKALFVQSKVSSPQAPANASDVAFVLPSVRHSSDKDMFYKPPLKSKEGKVKEGKTTASRKKIPPDVPIDTVIRRVGSNMPYHAATKIDKSEASNTNEYGSSHTSKKNIPDMLDIRDCLLLQHNEKRLNDNVSNALKSKA